MDTIKPSAAQRLTLGRKLLLALLAFTGLFIINFLAYNYLLRELDRTATATDAAGRQRMLSQKIAYTAFMLAAGHDSDRGALKEHTAEFHKTLEAFKRGGPSRDFFLRPAPEGMAALIKAEDAEWRPYRDAALTVSEAPADSPASRNAIGYIEAHSEALLAACEAVTTAFRYTAEDATRSLKQLMLLLIALGLLLGAIVFYFSKKNIVAPLAELDRAAAAITAGNFPELETKISGDEVGNLFNTFATMSRTIRRDLEKRSTIAALLAISLEHGSMAELLSKFLEHLLALPWLDIEKKGAILLADAGTKNLVMTAQRGMPGGLSGVCANVPFGHCLCGRAAAGKTVYATGLDERHDLSPQGIAPHGHYCLPITIQGKVAGVLNLYVRADHKYSESDQAFLEAACAIIAKAIDYKTLEGKAYQAQKMESLGKAAGAIAHDFNNILTSMKGFNELALETLPPGTEAARFVRETAAGIDKGAELIKQILAFSRKQPADMAGTDLNAVIEGARTMLGVVLEKKIRVKVSLAPGLPAITGNKGQLEQIIVNLAVNARDAMLPKGGEFSITTEEIPCESAGRCAAEVKDAQRVVKLSVSDTGCGMTEEVIAHIFEPFFTTKPEGQGTGLGLATVYSIVQLHKGGINITSRPGQGATFELCFPVTQ